MSLKAPNLMNGWNWCCVVGKECWEFVLLAADDVPSDISVSVQEYIGHHKPFYGYFNDIEERYCKGGNRGAQDA